MDGEFVDTSAWVPLFDADDSNHAAAAAHWTKLQQNRTPLYTTDYILDESITLARRRAGHAVAVSLGTAMLSSQAISLVEVTADLRGEAWLLFLKYTDKVLSFTDCVSFAAMHRLGLYQAFSFDEDFVQVGFVRRP